MTPLHSHWMEPESLDHFVQDGHDELVLTEYMVTPHYRAPEVGLCQSSQKVWLCVPINVVLVQSVSFRMDQIQQKLRLKQIDTCFSFECVQSHWLGRRGAVTAGGFDSLQAYAAA